MDVGCSCGDFGVLLQKEKECELIGMEIDPISIQIARETNVFSHLFEVDLNNLNEEFFKEYYNFFDYICLIDVLEHLTNPELVMLKMKKFLNTGGSFIISLPNLSFGDIKLNIMQNEFKYTDTGILDRTHIKFFTYKSIVDFTTDLNLKICISEAKIADISAKIGLNSQCIKRYICEDPHSYVYQYIIKATPTNLEISELRDINTEMIQPDWNFINQILTKERKIARKRKIVNFLLPINSNRRETVVKLYRLIKCGV